MCLTYCVPIIVAFENSEHLHSKRNNFSFDTNFTLNKSSHQKFWQFTWMSITTAEIQHDVINCLNETFDNVEIDMWQFVKIRNCKTSWKFTKIQILLHSPGSMLWLFLSIHLISAQEPIEEARAKSIQLLNAYKALKDFVGPYGNATKTPLQIPSAIAKVTGKNLHKCQSKQNFSIQLCRNRTLFFSYI